GARELGNDRERRPAGCVEREVDAHRDEVLEAQLVVGEVRVDGLGAPDGAGDDPFRARPAEPQERRRDDKSRSDDVVDGAVNTCRDELQLHSDLRFRGSPRALPRKPVPTLSPSWPERSSSSRTGALATSTTSATGSRPALSCR